MKKAVVAVLMMFSLLAAVSFGQELTSYRVAGEYVASAFNSYQLTQQNATVAGSQTVTTTNASIGTANGCVVQSKGFGAVTFSPLFVNQTLTSLDTNSETVTVTAVATTSPCSFTATFANAHPIGTLWVSGSAGLYEAINYASGHGGGLVAVGPDWTGTTANITNSTNAVGVATVVVSDRRSGSVAYTWNGSGYVAASGPSSYVTANGAQIIYGVSSELLTLSTGGATTDTSGNLLPANSVIDAVVGRVTTTISGGTCSSWQLGDATTAGRFTAANSTLTAGTTDIGKVAFTTGIASATTGIWQASAAKVRVTCGTGAPGAGAVRITVFYHTLVPPAS